MRAGGGGANLDTDRVLRDMLAEAHLDHPERRWKEEVIASMFRGRWSLAIGVALLCVGAAVACASFLLSAAFTETGAAWGRAGLTGVVPALAIVSLGLAAHASSRVLKVSWGAVALGVAGSAATSIACELWYVGVDAGELFTALLIAVACVAVALNGMAVAVLLRPLLRQLSLVGGVAVGLPVVAFGGAAVLLAVLPILTTVFIAVGTLTAVILLHRAERHVAAAATH
ncbi:hypothetical protein [Microbacterium sp. BLY]|uniref:hypothetical protein n=1 Tax=Microbacterium sp. BLY TaxID=2823280 RepID=UPI001B340017|nr:hypothetical protein [Microbacterium sp. BLY]MBP3976509.1 hypothetical protein [Microbacterium sp. BLY]